MAFTVVARNYLAHARVLARSFAKHHPGNRLHVFVLDDPAYLPADNEPFEQITLDRVNLSQRDFYRMAAIYDVVEFSTSVKPWILRHLLMSTADEVIYLDPDIEIFDSLEEVTALVRQYGLVLTPHALRPLPRDGLVPGDREILHAGVFNLGFLAVGSQALDFLDWWQERLRLDCVNKPAAGLFVDQRWIDFVPAYFDHYILRDPAYNVAYWNLANRAVRSTGNGYEVNGRPLRFFHFSGFSPEQPHLLSKHQREQPRILLSEEPELARLCEEYCAALVQAGYWECRNTPYGFDSVANGLPLDHRMRSLYRQALLAAGDRDIELPNPFAPNEVDAFIAWLNSPPADLSSVSRYLKAVHAERYDLQLTFPDLQGKDQARYLEWLRGRPVIVPPVPDALLPSREIRPNAIAPALQFGRLEAGVNVVGYVRAESGMGEVGRLLVATLKAAGVPYSVVPFGETLSRQQDPFSDTGRGSNDFDVNIICVNADQLEVFAKRAGEGFFAGRYNIGLWAWEVEELPEAMAASAKHVDEVWGISAHTARAISAAVSCPVRVFPLPVVPPRPARVTRADLALSDGFLFLFCFDFDSVFDRKNPLATIEAFCRAFNPGEGPHLVIKSINGHRHLPELERLRRSARGRPDIRVIDGYFTPSQQKGLMALCDAYVSLHRAEGFGLTLAEAMALGKPVIATSYSSNVEFMDGDNSLLVPYELVPIPPGRGPYPTSARWAEPNVETAAAHLRYLFEQPEAARKIGQAAGETIGRDHSTRVRASLLLEHLDLVRQSFGRIKASEALRLSADAGPTSAGDGREDPGKDAVDEETPHELEVLRLLDRGPRLDAPSRFGSLARVVRRLIFRLLQNYYVHQRTVVATTLKASRERMERATVTAELRLAARLEAHRPASQQSIEQLRQRLDSLSRLVAEQEGGLEALRARVMRRVTHTEQPAALSQLSERLDNLEGQVKAWAEGTVRRGSSAREGADTGASLGLPHVGSPASSRLLAVEKHVENRLDDFGGMTARRFEEQRNRFQEILDEAKQKLQQELQEQRRAVSEAIAQTETRAANSHSAAEHERTFLANRVVGLEQELRHTEVKIKTLRAEVRRALSPNLPEDRAEAEPQWEMIRQLERRVAVLSEELSASPFMSNPALLHTLDLKGREILGYSRYSGGPSQRPYLDFEDIFRGSQDFIADRQQYYLHLLAHLQPVLDFGCGRGEFLDLLAHAGLEAIGVDIDPDMVELCRKKGHRALLQDGLAFLEEQPAANFGAIFSAQVIEHLPEGGLYRFFTLGYSRLRSGGLLIAETVNPHSIRAFKAFWVDPSHRSPIFPEVALALCRIHGFADAHIVFPCGSDDPEEDRRSQGEFAVVARKSS